MSSNCRLPSCLRCAACGVRNLTLKNHYSADQHLWRVTLRMQPGVCCQKIHLPSIPASGLGIERHLRRECSSSSCNSMCSQTVSAESTLAREDSVRYHRSLWCVRVCMCVCVFVCVCLCVCACVCVCCVFSGVLCPHALDEICITTCIGLLIPRFPLCALLVRVLVSGLAISTDKPCSRDLPARCVARYHIHARGGSLPRLVW